jgi:hypothetical protein
MYICDRWLSEGNSGVMTYGGEETQRLWDAVATKPPSAVLLVCRYVL